MRFLSLVGMTALMVALGGPSTVSAQEGTPLKSTELKAMLSKMGYEMKEVGDELYEVTVDRDNWQVFVTMSVSKDGKLVWLDCKFPELTSPDTAPGAAYLRLLQENANVAPNFFAFNKVDNRIHIYRALDNKNVTSGQVRREITQFDQTVRTTVDLWRPEAFVQLGGGGNQGNNAATERTKVLGKWKVTTIELNGNRLTEDDLAGRELTLTFTANGELTIRRPDAEDDIAKWTIDATTNPKQINVTNKDNKLEKGIYKIVGDTMTLCYSDPNNDRPSKYEAPEGFKGGVFILKKGGEQPMPPVVNPVAKEKARFIGKWKVIGIELNGATLGEDDLADSAMTLTFEAEKMTIRRKGADDDVTDWTFDSKQSPPWVNITNKEGKLEKSIYKFEGNTLTICFSDPGQPRPTKFEAPAGFKGGVLVLKKGN